MLLAGERDRREDDGGGEANEPDDGPDHEEDQALRDEDARALGGDEQGCGDGHVPVLAGHRDDAEDEHEQR